jgi:hypothetical protein
MAGRLYQVEFRLGTSKERGRNGSASVTVDVHDGDGIEPVWPYLPTGPILRSAEFRILTESAHIVWERKRLNFVAAGPNSTLHFHTDNATGQFVNLDDVRVSDCPPAECIELTGPDGIVVPCSDVGGAFVPFFVTATNLCGVPQPTVTCDPPSGSRFPIGTTIVHCRATTSDGTNQISFPVSVVCPALPVECTGIVQDATGAAVQ